jgi:hypothetical protein
MAMYDFDSPNLYSLDLEKKYDLNKEDIYYVAFYHQGKFHSRPIQIIGKAWGVYNHNYSEIIREETDWKYIFKTKNIFSKKAERQIIFKDDSGYGFDSLNIFLIGRTKDEAILRSILFNIGNTINLKDHELMMLQNESDKYQKEQPILFDYISSRDDFKIAHACGNFMDNFKKIFVNNKDDILNEEFFT